MGFMKNKPSRNRAATIVTATNSPGTHPSRIPSFDADISSQDHPNYPTMGRCLHPLCKPDKIYRDLKRISHIGPSTRVFSCPGRALAETVLVGGTWKVTLGPGLLECSGGPYWTIRRHIMCVCHCIVSECGVQLSTFGAGVQDSEFECLRNQGCEDLVSLSLTIIFAP
ncbi:hypothetical protein BDV37DRAFT_84730 [Aspergillus pseudonomiae]|uniref:Uncharacterized protein n=1 Tax=Aspergillus pseudonomiae TaxID=1506151 RepID=A0A5N7CS11_9EURO|nr:uncharacterized protein BDV37DRAFT_84730 [Aspergillus pseudonomiae]KAE8396991.1 hypothetical protein BDV37DRAFT_84730 [Aspergillus pseudonomiae]